MGYLESINQTNQLGKEASKDLNRLMQITKERVKDLEKQIESGLRSGKMLGNTTSTSSFVLPVASIQNKKIEYRYISNKTPLDNAADIEASIADMFSSQRSAHTIAKILNPSIAKLIGVSDGFEQHFSATLAFVDGSGMLANIVRFDTILLSRSVQEPSLKDIISKTLIAVTYKSIIDIYNIPYEAFNRIYIPFAMMLYHMWKLRMQGIFIEFEVVWIMKVLWVALTAGKDNLIFIGGNLVVRIVFKSFQVLQLVILSIVPNLHPYC